MILADSPVWIRHFSTPNHPLATELIKNNISIYNIVIGELASGSLRLRGATLADLNDLPQVIGVQHADVFRFIEYQKLYSRGVGYSAGVTDCRAQPGLESVEHHKQRVTGYNDMDQHAAEIKDD